MALNDTPSANRIHISLFGCRNAGKSSLINAITDQNLAIVSDVKGTTTDPVYKSMELLPLGPVMLIDTAGLDDAQDALGKQRVKKSLLVLNKTDIALLVVDATAGLSKDDREILDRIRKKNIPCVLAWNKCDDPQNIPALPSVTSAEIAVSAVTGFQIQELKELLAKQLQNRQQRPLVSDLIQAGDYVVLVTPIDAAAPKGRLILPQQQVIRDLLDHGGIPVVTQIPQLNDILKTLSGKIRMVITDSQAFGAVGKIVPKEIPLTSFSILMARFKGILNSAIAASEALDQLKSGDRILIAEGCTHHRQCNDIGTVKLPNWIKAHAAGKELIFEYSSGISFPETLKPYKLIIHCGGCMLNEREVQYRYQCAMDENIPMTNYGLAIAHLHGILARSLGPLKTPLKQS